jgi:hypothetical protein
MPNLRACVGMVVLGTMLAPPVMALAQAQPQAAPPKAAADAGAAQVRRASRRRTHRTDN